MLFNAMSDDPTPQPEPRALAPRKRVVAREVTDVEAANIEAASLAPEVIAPARPEQEYPADPVVVVDPTTLGGRRRRTSHQRIYRWTQACSIIAFLAGIVSGICTVAEDLHVARALAAPALAVGALATYLSGRTSLSQRWRGWAIASVVFAAVALGLTWLWPAVFGEDHPGDLRPKPAVKSAAPADARQP
jgi:hypothetical protein